MSIVFNAIVGFLGSGVKEISVCAAHDKDLIVEKRNSSAKEIPVPPAQWNWFWPKGIEPVCLPAAPQSTRSLNILPPRGQTKKPNMTLLNPESVKKNEK